MSEIPDAPHSALHDLNKQIVKGTASIADDADSGPETADSSAAALGDRPGAAEGPARAGEQVNDSVVVRNSVDFRTEVMRLRKHGYKVYAKEEGSHVAPVFLIVDSERDVTARALFLGTHPPVPMEIFAQAISRAGEDWNLAVRVGVTGSL